MLNNLKTALTVCMREGQLHLPEYHQTFQYSEHNNLCTFHEQNAVFHQLQKDTSGQGQFCITALFSQTRKPSKDGLGLLGRIWKHLCVFIFPQLPSRLCELTNFVSRNLLLLLLEKVVTFHFMLYCVLGAIASTSEIDQLQAEPYMRDSSALHNPLVYWP